MSSANRQLVKEIAAQYIKEEFLTEEDTENNYGLLVTLLVILVIFIILS